MAVATQQDVQVTRYRFSADQLQRLVEVGIVTDGTRVELIRGELLMMDALDARDVACIGQTLAVLGRQVPDNAIVLPQCSIQIAGDGVPQPDFTLASRDYERSKLPTPADVFVIIELANLSLAFDREVKLPLYGGAGIPEAWIFDLTSNWIERHTDPHAAGYGSIAVAGPGERMSSATLPDLAFEVDDVLALSPRQ